MQRRRRIFAEAQDLVEGLVPAATALAFDKIKGKALDGTFLA